MMNKNEIKEMLGKVFQSKNRSLANHQIMHPAREWFLGLLAGLIMAGLGGFWSVNSYLQYSEVSLNSNDIGETDVVVYRESVVKAAQSDFSERAVKYEKLKSELLSFNKTVVIPISTSTPTSTPSSISTSTIDVTSEDDVHTDENNSEIIEEVPKEDESEEVGKPKKPQVGTVEEVIVGDNFVDPSS